MRILKKLAAVLLMLGMLFSLVCHASTWEDAYNEALTLLNLGDYAGAAEQFAALGSYEDASQMTMYAKAYAAAESGNYDAAISTFTSLGSFKDCELLVSYYSGRMYEEQGKYETAIEYYDKSPLFKDSSERRLHIGFVDVKATDDPERWMVCNKDDEYYALNIAEKTLAYSGKWYHVSYFSEGLAPVIENDKHGYINTSLTLPANWRFPANGMRHTLSAKVLHA